MSTKQVLELAQKLLTDVRIQNDYIGKGNFGDEYKLCFISSARPNSNQVREFIRLTEMKWDNYLGNFVYFK